MKRIAASLIVLAATSSAYALDFAGEMYMVGTVGRVGISQTDIQVANNNTLKGKALASILGYSSLTGLQSAQTTSDTGFKLQLGYEFSPNFAVEGGYVDLGKTNYLATYTSTDRSWWIPGSISSAGKVNRTEKITGWNVAGLGIYPINDRFSLFAKLGVIDAKVKYSNTGSGTFSTNSETDDSKWKAYYGLGATYYPNRDRNFGIRAEVERFSKIGDSSTTGSTDVNLMSLGVSSKF